MKKLLFFIAIFVIFCSFKKDINPKSSYVISVTAADIAASSQGDYTTALCVATLRQLQNEPDGAAVIVGQSFTATTLSIDGWQYSEDPTTLLIQTIQRGTGVKPLLPFTAYLTKY